MGTNKHSNFNCCSFLFVSKSKKKNKTVPSFTSSASSSAFSSANFSTTSSSSAGTSHSSHSFPKSPHIPEFLQIWPRVTTTISTTTSTSTPTSIPTAYSITTSSHTSSIATLPPSASSTSKGATGPENVSHSGTLIPGLPEEIALSCLARIPTSTRMKLRSVSREWREECCGEAVNQARARDGLLLDPCYICRCPVMEVREHIKRLQIKEIKGQNSCESWRSKATTDYFKKRFEKNVEKNVEKNSEKRQHSSASLPLDAQNFVEICAEEEEDRILNCLSKLRQQLVSNEKFEPPRNDFEMYKNEMKRHRDTCTLLRLAVDEVPHPSSWKSRFRLPHLTNWDHDAAFFFLIL